MRVPQLPPGNEFEALKSLSEGLPTLVKETQAVFFDTSLLLNGLLSFQTFGLRQLERYMKITKSGKRIFNLRSLSTVFQQYEQDSSITLDGVMDLVDENVLRSDILLQTLNELVLQQNNFFLPDIVFYESNGFCSGAKTELSHFLGNYRETFRKKEKSKTDNQMIRGKKNFYAQYHQDAPVDVAPLEKAMKKNFTLLSKRIF